MLIVAGWLKVDEKDRDSFVRECAHAVELARSSPGCADFSITADSVDPGRVNIFERWNSEAELLEFRGSGPDSDQQAAIHDASVARYTISAVGDA